MPSKKLSFKLLDVYAVFLALTETEKLNVKGIPFKLAWEIADIKEIFRKPAVRLEEERNKILNELGKPGTAPGAFEIEATNLEQVNVRMKELHDTEVEIEFTPIHISRIEGAPDFQFAPGAFNTLRKDIIEFPVKKTEKKEEKKEEEITV